jgi:hypothetical protein
MYIISQKFILREEAGKEPNVHYLIRSEDQGSMSSSEYRDV